jgi:hypothetical protein
MGVGQTVLAVPRDSDIPAELTRLERFRISGGRVDVDGWTGGQVDR